MKIYGIPQLHTGQEFDLQYCTGPKILRTKCPPEFDEFHCLMNISNIIRHFNPDHPDEKVEYEHTPA